MKFQRIEVEMWHWPQGRLQYFQFDALRKISKFALAHDLRNSSSAEMEADTGLPFRPQTSAYPPWRNYQGVFGVALLATEDGKSASATKLASILAQDGMVTSDDYFHFLAEATSEPSPALANWDSTVPLRFPLLFALKYLLAKAATGSPVADMDEIIGAYATSGLVGDEDQTAFLVAMKHGGTFGGDVRQAKESLRVLGQISYLYASRNTIEVALSEEDALLMFNALSPIGGAPASDPEAEIARRSKLFLSKIADLDFDYVNTVIGVSADAGFDEGTKIQKTHIVIERNPKLRSAFFLANPSAVCDVCRLDTKASYPWVDRVLDVHHLLPLSSGTRTNRTGTVLDDLVANCPTCHRAVHRYYNTYLIGVGRKDFLDDAEAKSVYASVKKDYAGPIHA